MKTEIKGCPKKIYLASPRGFCAGVKNAIDTVEKLAKESSEPIYVRHEIVHNRYVIENLKRKGVIFVESLSSVPMGARIVFSAHGVSSSTETEALKRGLKITDATCPIVRRIHNLANSFSQKGFSIILIGHRVHPEIIGTSGRIKGKFYIVEEIRDIKKIPRCGSDKFVCLTQTTLNPQESKKIYKSLKKRLGSKLAPFKDNICYATRERQAAVRKLAMKSDAILVIGSSNSSNSLRLKEIAEKSGAKAYLIEDEKSIKKSMFKGKFSIGITSGASAPEQLVRATISKLESMGWIMARSKNSNNKDGFNPEFCSDKNQSSRKKR
ncbi:MAG TPA: 4-hydroxy-3-methylbut-2-enyl diphosphate reductase [Victivallales bacterium]|nr:4-hydroxy-3-methylbut-2-enyl diphosphate reductase [Victivallales bacterium]